MTSAVLTAAATVAIFAVLVPAAVADSRRDDEPGRLPDRCDVGGCHGAGLWLPPDGGPGALCTFHARQGSEHDG